MTTMQAALETAGFSKANCEAFAWAKRYIAQGGTREGWVEAFDMAAERMRSECQALELVLAHINSEIQAPGPVGMQKKNPQEN